MSKDGTRKPFSEWQANKNKRRAKRKAQRKSRKINRTK